MDPLASADVIWCENVSVSNKLFHGVSAKEHPSFNFRTGAQHRFLCSGSNPLLPSIIHMII